MNHPRQTVLIGATLSEDTHARLRVGQLDIDFGSKRTIHYSRGKRLGGSRWEGLQRVGLLPGWPSVNDLLVPKLVIVKVVGAPLFDAGSQRLLGEEAHVVIRLLLPTLRWHVDGPHDPTAWASGNMEIDLSVSVSAKKKNLFFFFLYLFLTLLRTPS